MQWSEREFHEALAILRAEQGYKITEEELMEETQKIEQQRGFVLGVSYEGWQPFIKDGALDEAALLEANYTQEQIPYIREEMTARGWLKGASGAQVSAEAAAIPAGTVLGRDHLFWASYITKDGRLREDMLAAAGYDDATIGRIKSEALAAGWLAKEEQSAPAPVAASQETAAARSRRSQQVVEPSPED